MRVYYTIAANDDLKRIIKISFAFKDVRNKNIEMMQFYMSEFSM